MLPTEHDHFPHHEAIRLACERSGATARRVRLYDNAAAAHADPDAMPTPSPGRRGVPVGPGRQPSAAPNPRRPPVAESKTDWPSDPDDFLVVRLPWLLAPRDQGGRLTVESIVRLPVPGDGGTAGQAVPLFTDGDLADRFATELARQGTSDVEPFRLDEWPQLAAVLAGLRQSGVEYVAFDPAPGRAVRRPIGAVIAAFRRR